MPVRLTDKPLRVRVKSSISTPFTASLNVMFTVPALVLRGLLTGVMTAVGGEMSVVVTSTVSACVSVWPEICPAESCAPTVT